MPAHEYGASVCPRKSQARGDRLMTGGVSSGVAQNTKTLRFASINAAPISAGVAAMMPSLRLADFDRIMSLDLGCLGPLKSTIY